MLNCQAQGFFRDSHFSSSRCLVYPINRITQLAIYLSDKLKAATSTEDDNNSPFLTTVIILCRVLFLEKNCKKLKISVMNASELVLTQCSPMNSDEIPHVLLLLL